jgi:exopolyphosphatase/guanosine-5'-triphosphate,3'-diphosphate pyrophosphatase
VEALELPGLAAERAAVLAGGLAILRATFDGLDLASMRTSRAALREGALHDLLGRIHHEDVRDRTIRALSERYSVDAEQAARVERTALSGLDQVAAEWDLERRSSARLLAWAARTHEVGLAISYSGHHKHGAYILAHSDMPGFSREDQERLAALVRGHRRKPSPELFSNFGGTWRKTLFRLCVLLRIAVRLNRSRSGHPILDFRLKVEREGLSIHFPSGWLDEHPLTRADLEDEAAVLQSGAGLLLALDAPEGNESSSAEPRGSRLEG